MMNEDIGLKILLWEEGAWISWGVSINKYSKFKYVFPWRCSFDGVLEELVGDIRRDSFCNGWNKYETFKWCLLCVLSVLFLPWWQKFNIKKWIWKEIIFASAFFRVVAGFCLSFVRIFGRKMNNFFHLSS